MFLSRLLNNSLVRLVSTSHRYRIVTLIFYIEFFFIKNKNRKTELNKFLINKYTLVRVVHVGAFDICVRLCRFLKRICCVRIRRVCNSLFIFFSLLFRISFWIFSLSSSSSTATSTYRYTDCMISVKVTIECAYERYFFFSCCIVLDAATVCGVRVSMCVSVLSARMCGRGKQQNTMRKRRKRKMIRDERKRKRNNE